MGASISKVLFETAEGGPTQVLHCTGTTRYSSGEDERSFFYPERFPNGEEYWGIREYCQNSSFVDIV